MSPKNEGAKIASVYEGDKKFFVEKYRRAKNNAENETYKILFIASVVSNKSLSLFTITFILLPMFCKSVL